MTISSVEQHDVEDPHEHLPDLRQLLGRRTGDAVLRGEDDTVEVALPGYGFRWLRVLRSGDRRLA